MMPWPHHCKIREEPIHQKRNLTKYPFTASLPLRRNPSGFPQGLWPKVYGLSDVEYPAVHRPETGLTWPLKALPDHAEHGHLAGHHCEVGHPPKTLEHRSGVGGRTVPYSTCCRESLIKSPRGGDLRFWTFFWQSLEFRALYRLLWRACDCLKY